MSEEKKHVKFYDLITDPNESVNVASKKMYSDQLKSTYDLLIANIETNRCVKFGW